MYPSTDELKDLIAKAEAGETEAAREGLREFTKRRPSVLLAWKWLADVAENARERAEAIRRAQLLAPGDPWVIEAKKHRMPPQRPPRKAHDELEVRPLSQPLAAPAPPPPVVVGRSPTPEDITLVNRMRSGEALERAVAASQPEPPHGRPAPLPEFESEALPEPVALPPDEDLQLDWSLVDDILPEDATVVNPAVALGDDLAPSVAESDPAPAGSFELGGGWLLWVVVALAVLGIGLLLAALLIGNVL